jgi:Na+:H+ antiporter
LHAITSTQSDAFILAAVIVCIVSPIVFNSNFVLSPEDRMKETVTIVGANTFTVPVAHDLHDNWYTIKMFTDQQDQYETYDSRVKGLTLLDNLDNQSLERSGAFDCDIFVAAGHHDQENARMAEYAKDLGVKRAIARMNEVDSDTMARCQEAGVELFNFTNVRSALMRALIESPTVYKIMTDTNNVLYSVKVRSTSYTGRPLRDLEFVDKITVSRIRRGDEWLIPHGWTVIEPNDILIFSGEFKVADRVKKLLSHQN